MRSFFSSSSSPTSLQRCCQALKSHLLWSLLRSDPLLLYHFLLRSSGFQSHSTSSSPSNRSSTFQSLLALSRASFFSTLSSFDVRTSIDFFDLPDNLLLEDGQDSVIFAYLFEHHPAVKLVAYLLEIIPEKRAKSLNSPAVTFTQTYPS